MINKYDKSCFEELIKYISIVEKEEYKDYILKKIYKKDYNIDYNKIIFNKYY
tara:strand:- start:2746 stop:2901 length:156 start_codon:yes stop_codon:yes gene_type:complete